MKNKFCILFAGAMGSSKTPIAHYLSYKLSLPILNHDILRREVGEDLLEFIQEKYEEKRDERLLDLLKRGASFIYDASIDRSWRENNLKRKLIKFGYRYFIISIDLSGEFLKKLYKVKGYQDLEGLNRTVNDHNAFLDEYGDIVGVNISDENFKNRLKLSLEAVENWMKG